MRKKEEKGITLIILTITIAVMLIITSTLIYNLDNHMSVKKVNNLYYDIDMIGNRVSEYYLEKGDVPIIENCFFNADTLKSILVDKGATEPVFNVNDDQKYYAIDLSKFDNLTLNYGEEYKKCKNFKANGFTSLTGYLDVYYINLVTLEIYYPKGVNSNGKFYYTKNMSQSTDSVTAIQ